MDGSWKSDPKSRQFSEKTARAVQGKKRRQMIWSKTLLKEEKLKNKDLFRWENQRIIG